MKGRLKQLRWRDIGSKINHFFSRFKKVESNGAHNKVEVYEIFFIKGIFLQHKSRDTRIRLKNILEIINVVEDLWRLCLTKTCLKSRLTQSMFHQLMFSATRKIISLLLCSLANNITMERSNIPNNDGNGRINLDSSMLASEDLLDLCLVGYLLTIKPIKFITLKDRLAQLWQGQGVAISKMEENKFLVQFFHAWDMGRVYQGGLWLFKNYMLVLRKLKFGEEPPMNEAEIWVQIHQLPFGLMSEDVGILIGNHIGKFITYDEQNNYGTWRKYMRIRVAINVQDPLKKSLSFDRLDGDQVHVIFKYEKRGIFCFLCGSLGHSEIFATRNSIPIAVMK